MKTKFIILVLLTVGNLSAQLDIKIEKLPPVKNPQPKTIYSTMKMTVNATYNGKDVFIQNAFGKNGIGFCVSQVKVNQNTTADEINAMFFKVDLEAHKLRLGEKFQLIVYYKDSCSNANAPFIMNPAALMQRDTSGTSLMVMEGKNWNTTS